MTEMFRERWQRQQSVEVDEGEASLAVEAATIRKLGLALPVLPIQVMDAGILSQKNRVD